MERYAVVLLLISAISATAQSSGDFYETFKDCRHVAYKQMEKYALQVPIRQLEDFLNGTDVTIIPEMPAYRLRSLCPYLQEFMNCLQNLRPSENAKIYEHEMYIKFLKLEIAFVCDTDIQDSLQCLGEIEQRPSNDCYRDCAQLMMQLKDEMANENMTRYNWSTVISTGCQFVVCRVKCQKQSILSECKPSGLEAIKKSLRLISEYFRETSEIKEARFPFPEGCNIDQLRDI